MQKNNSFQKVIFTPKGVASHPRLFDPYPPDKANNRGAKWALDLIYDTDEEVAPIFKEMKTLWDSTFGDQLSFEEAQKQKHPKAVLVWTSKIFKGDDESKPITFGKWVVRSSCDVTNRYGQPNPEPKVVDETGQNIITDPSVIYGGCYGRASIQLTAYSFPFNIPLCNATKLGISFKLLGFHFLGDGPRLGSVVPEFDFSLDIPKTIPTEKEEITDEVVDTVFSDLEIPY